MGVYKTSKKQLVGKVSARKISQYSSKIAGVKNEVKNAVCNFSASVVDTHFIDDAIKNRINKKSKVFYPNTVLRGK